MVVVVVVGRIVVVGAGWVIGAGWPPGGILSDLGRSQAVIPSAMRPPEKIVQIVRMMAERMGIMSP